MLDLTPLVEPLSLDEAFLDLSGTERLHHAPPAVTLARLQRRIEHDLGLTVSIGLSHNKFLAKIASDLDKPRGFKLIGRAETPAFLARQPVSVIWGVGRAAVAALERDGIRTIADLRARDRKQLDPPLRLPRRPPLAPRPRRRRTAGPPRPRRQVDLPRHHLRRRPRGHRRAAVAPLVARRAGVRAGEGGGGGRGGRWR